MSICGLQLQINSSGPILTFFLNLLHGNIIGTYSSILPQFWGKIVNICDRNNNLKCTYPLQTDVLGQIRDFTALFITDIR